MSKSLLVGERPHVETMARYPTLVARVHILPHEAQYVLVHQDAPRWAVVNATGLHVARLCDGRHTPGEIAANIASAYGLTPEVVAPDVLACLDDLVQAGFLDSQPQALAKGGNGKTSGWSLHLYIIDQCNLRCRHCALAAGPLLGTWLEANTAYRLIDEAVDANVEAIAFSGGEPLLHPDIMDLLAHTAGRTNTLLATNGTLINRRVAGKLAELGVSVQISLDGATAEVHDAIRGRGAFARTWQGIERLQSAGIGEHLALNVTLMRPNIGQVREFVDLAATRGIPGLRFIQVQKMGRAAKLWEDLAPNNEQYAEAYRYLYLDRPENGVAVSPGLTGLDLEAPAEGWCPLGRLLIVDAGGDIYPCSLLMAAPFRLGNMAELSLADALASPALLSLVAACGRRKERISACRRCALQQFCCGGCPASVWLEQGTWLTTDAMCDLRHNFLPTLAVASLLKRI